MSFYLDIRRKEGVCLYMEFNTNLNLNNLQKEDTEVFIYNEIIILIDRL